MRHFLAVFGREIEENRLVVPVCAGIGLLSLLAPFLSVAASASEARGAMALGVGVTISGVLALVFGASVLGRDLSERRLGFYFSRPLAGWAIWTGKLAAAAAIALAAGFVALLPALVLGDLWRFLPKEWVRTTLFAPVVVVALVLLAHAASTAFRARSAWLGVDVAGLAIILALSYFAGRKLALAGAIDSIFRIQPLLALGALAALVAAITIQMSGGRADLHRGYRLLSLTLWGLLLVLALGYAAYARWTVDVSLADLAAVRGLTVSPDGRFAAVHGPARLRGQYEPTLLVDLASRRSRVLRTGAWPQFPSWVAFSADGRRAVWLEPEGSAPDSRLELLRLDLTRQDALPVATTLSYARGAGWDVALSPDGRLIATVAGSRWRVEEIDGGRLLAAAAVPPSPSGTTRQLRFLGPRRIRLEETMPVAEAEGTPELTLFQAFDLDLGDPHARPVGTFRANAPYFLASPAGDRILSLTTAAPDDLGRFQLTDLATGRTIAEVPRPDRRTTMGFLRDGRLLQATNGKATPAQLAVFDRDGRPQGAPIRLDGRNALIGGQPDADHLVLSLSPAFAGGPGGRLMLVDLRDGRVRQVATGLLPFYGSVWNDGWPWRTAVPTGLYRTLDGGLVELDLATGRRSTIVKGERGALPRR